MRVENRDLETLALREFACDRAHTVQRLWRTVAGHKHSEHQTGSFIHCRAVCAVGSAARAAATGSGAARDQSLLLP
jgi:hypothetical protein